MRIQEIDMLKDTLRVFEEGFFIRKGKRRDIKLSKEALKDAKVLLLGQVEYICNNPGSGETYKKEDPKYFCENEDSFSAALRIKKANPDDKVLVLNFANPVHPGGGVRRGARAQEEDLCRKSSLLLSLEGDNARGYYKYNRSLNSLMGSDAIIINPTVEIIKDAKGGLLDDSVIVSVMTCAAPMISRGLEGMREEEYEALFFNRIVATLKVAAYYKYKYLVLGAWGCGAFSNDAKIVSRLYFKALEEVKYSDIYLKDLFKEIYFAVLSRSANKYNYNAFAEYFKKGKADINFFDGKNEAKGNLIKTGKGIFGAVAGAGDKIKNSDAARKIADMAGGSAKSLTAGAKSVGNGAKKAVEAMANQPVFDILNKKKENLDSLLKEAVDEYNIAYTLMSDSGSGLHLERTRSVDLIKNIENLINSIAHHPKEFDAKIKEVEIMRREFTDLCNFAKMEIEAAKNTVMSAGAGIAGGTAVAALAPSAAMWVATTFGTASTGTAISALSGAAAQSAAMAWLGGGTLAVGGGGMAAGQALLAMAGPIGWSIAGASLLTSIMLFNSKAKKLGMQKKEEIELVIRNTESIKEADAKIKNILDKTVSLRDLLNEQYSKCLNLFGKDFLSMGKDEHICLGTLVNETRSLAFLLGEEI